MSPSDVDAVALLRVRDRLGQRAEEDPPAAGALAPCRSRPATAGRAPRAPTRLRRSVCTSDHQPLPNALPSSGGGLPKSRGRRGSRRTRSRRARARTSRARSAATSRPSPRSRGRARARCRRPRRAGATPRAPSASSSRIASRVSGLLPRPVTRRSQRYSSQPRRSVVAPSSIARVSPARLSLRLPRIPRADPVLEPRHALDRPVVPVVVRGPPARRLLVVPVDEVALRRVQRRAEAA